MGYPTLILRHESLKVAASPKLTPNNVITIFQEIAHTWIDVSKLPQSAGCGVLEN